MTSKFGAERVKGLLKKKKKMASQNSALLNTLVITRCVIKLRIV